MYHKFTKIKYIIKIGFLIELYVQYTNLEWFIEKIKELIGRKEQEFEIRKEYIYEKAK